MYQVTKRDGKNVDFNITRIANAITKAFEATGIPYNPDIINMLSLQVTADYAGKIMDNAVSVESIQDSVEAVLQRAGYADVAKAYILYRKNREKLRSMSSTILDYKGLVDGYLKVSDWRVKENSTVTYSVGGLILSNSGAITANYWLSEIYDQEIGDAHRNADLHIHDLSMLTGYCAGWSLKQLIQEGLGGVVGKITSAPAKHLATLCNQMVNFLGIMQNEWAGAQAFSSFDTYLAPFVKTDKLTYNEVKHCIESFIFGVAGGTGPLGWKPHLALGVNGLRVNPGWNHIQPREGIWSWEGHDRTFADRNAAGFASLYILTPPPAWLADKDSDSKIFNPQMKVNQLLPERNALRTFLQRFATRYKGKVEFYVIGNEPDLVGFWNFSEEEYLKMLEISYRTIKAADPDALVMNGGISSLYSQTPKAAPENRRLHPTIMRRILKEGNIDIFNYHGHGPIHNYWSCLDEMRKEGILNKFPWYSGETGVSLRDSAGVLEPGKPINPITIRKKQAEIIHEKVSIAKALGARGYTLWVLWDLQNWPEDHPEKYGALEPDGQPNTVFPVYANVIRHLQATRPDRIFAEGGLFAYGYTRNAGGYIVSCWNDDGNQPGRPVIFTGVTGAAEKIDLFGNITPLAVQEGVCTFVVTCEPCFLRFPSQSETPGFHTPLTGDMASISAGKNGSLKFKLKNPFTRKLTASLAFAYPEHLTGPATRSVVLAPKAETGVSIPIAAAPGFISLPQNPTGVRISLALGDSAPISFVYPVIGKIMLTRGADEGAPQFVLDRADQIYSYAISGPEQDLIWRGPEDLSAEVRLAAKDRTFEIQVEVTDDIHIQPYTGSTVWNGDSIQIGLKLSSQPRAWHFILAMLPDGKPQVTCDSRGSGAFDWAAAAAELDLAVSRDEGAKLTRYRLNIPFDAIGLTPADAAEGFRFNLMVNDNDGPKRESCISVAPSLNTSKNDALYPVICFQ